MTCSADLPRNFMEWTSEWGLSTAYQGEGYEWMQWCREYREESHCGTPGCCEMELPFFGPVAGPLPLLWPMDTDWW